MMGVVAQRGIDDKLFARIYHQHVSYPLKSLGSHDGLYTGGQSSSSLSISYQSIRSAELHSTVSHAG